MTAVFVPTAHGLLADAEEEAREKYFGWVDDGFWHITRQGVGLVELPRYTIGVDTVDGVFFRYWYLRRDYVTSGKLPMRMDAVRLVDLELAGCTCGVVADVLCPACGDPRDTSVAQLVGVRA